MSAAILGDGRRFRMPEDDFFPRPEAVVDEVCALGVERDDLLRVPRARPRCDLTHPNRPERSVGIATTPSAPRDKDTLMAHPRVLATGQRCQIWIGGPDLAAPELVHETDSVLFEAPNWTLDGKRLVLNGDGGLWTLDLTSPDAGPSRVDLGQLPDLNNDHVLSPDGEHVYLSAMDTHIYRAPLAGGAAQRMTPEDGRWHFLHGVSPDDRRLAYVQISDMGQPGQLAVLEPDRSVSIIDVGGGHLDGPEWSPDGQWIYLNTETFTSAPGHAQLARVPDGGGPVERLLSSDTVDWFPHLSPDGRLATYISFPAGTLGHPADLDVEVSTVATDDWTTPLQRYRLFGGQGTLNVNSWAPHSNRFAFVAYPVA